MNGRWGYKIVRGIKCQFPRVLMEASVALHNGAWKGSVLAEWMEEEIGKRVGFIAETEGIEEGEKFRKFVKKKVRVGSMEMSEMCRVFFIWGIE